MTDDAVTRALPRALLALRITLGLLLTAAAGAALVLHAVTVLVSWRQLLDPWGEPGNHLFIASVPVLGGLVALFLLRRWAEPPPPA